ncbi:MAG: PaaI family thioesterase [Bacteroidales bacterium]|jgi:uncharacterized protein (TIGR00369 family)|nr:PaaI family thioesterase [Bacteroidales bacterium]
MRKLLNPFSIHDPEHYKCFGCSPKNEDGLQMEFYEDGEYIVSKWSPKKKFEGYYEVLHGGIQATMIDEIACWVVYVQAKTGGVTADLNVKYKRPVILSNGTITLKAKLKDFQKRLASVDVELYDGEGTLCATGDVRYFVYPEKIAREKFKYPGHEAFFE